MNLYFWFATIVVFGHIAGLSIYLHYRRAGARLIDDAMTGFHKRREWLEADFLTAASSSGKPRGLRWSDVDFEDGVTFARDRGNGQVRAFVGVTIGFEAVEGGGMEEVEAVGNLRTATAVFRYNGDRWTTDGRTLFNLGPAEAVLHFQHELELLPS